MTGMHRRLRSLTFLKSHWRSLMPLVDLPSDAQFSLWLDIYRNDIETILYGIGETAEKNIRSGCKLETDSMYAIRFASSCMNHRRRLLELAKRQRREIRALSGAHLHA